MELGASRWNLLGQLYQYPAGDKSRIRRLSALRLFIPVWRRIAAAAPANRKH